MNRYTDYSALNSVITLVPLAIFVFCTIPIWIGPYFIYRLIKKSLKGINRGIKSIRKSVGNGDKKREQRE
jgi:hypothetical protein